MKRWSIEEGEGGNVKGYKGVVVRGRNGGKWWDARLDVWNNQLTYIRLLAVTLEQYYFYRVYIFK